MWCWEVKQRTFAASRHTAHVPGVGDSSAVLALALRRAATARPQVLERVNAERQSVSKCHGNRNATEQTIRSQMTC
jgi:hypothetical protein